MTKRTKEKNVVQCRGCGKIHDYSKRDKREPVGDEASRAGIRVYSISVCPKCGGQEYLELGD